MLSGLLLAGALPHLDWGGLAWIGLVPFLSLFPFRNTRTAFWHGLTLGVFYLGVMAYWIIIFAGHIIGPAMSTLGWALVTLYQAFYLAVWAAGAQWLRGRPNPWAWRLGVPALWAIVEWWRQSGPLALGWGDLAYTQHFALPILQITKLTGIWGLAFLIVLVNVMLTELGTKGPLKNGKAGEAKSLSLVTAALVLAALAYGEWTLHHAALAPNFVAAALQGNLNQNVPQNPAYTERVLQTFSMQSHQAAAQNARLVVWPETAFPGFLQADSGTRARVAADAVKNRQAMVIGGVEFDPNVQKNANTLFMMTANGTVTGGYEKQQLVPFGEFVPGRTWMPFLESLHVTIFDMKAGADRQPLLDGGPLVGKLGTVICFESSYPRFTQEQVAHGAGLLVISTDDTWFGRTAAARQHSAIAAVRAAETDRYLVRSAATGVSQIIDPTGRVLAEAELFQTAVVSAPVQSRQTETLYVRWGDWFVWACALLLAAVSVPHRKVSSMVQTSALTLSLWIALAAATAPVSAQTPPLRTLDGPLTTRTVAGPGWAKNQPIYEVNLDRYGFPKGAALREYEKHLPVLKKMGIGLIWFMPLHPRGQKKGFGSPYSVRDYTDINPDFGTKAEFRHLVTRAHALGLHVLMDWVPNHTSWDNPMIDAHPEFYVKNDKGEITQAGSWADVAQLDYGQPGHWNQPLWNQMRDDMTYWVREFGIDGFRCDVAGRAGKVPAEFWTWLRPQIDAVRPVFLLAEADDPYLHPAFDMTYSWDLPPVLWDICAGRKPATAIDAVLQKEADAFPPGSVLMRFLDNHDWHPNLDWGWGGGPAVDTTQGLAQVAPLMVLCATLPGKPLLYNGQEMGFVKSDPPRQAKVREQSPVWPFYKRLLELYQSKPAVSEGRFTKLVTPQDSSVYAFLRQHGQERVLVLVNLSAKAQSVELPSAAVPGKYRDWFGNRAVTLNAASRVPLSPWGYCVYVRKN